MGYTLPRGARAGFGALDLALWDGKQFVYAGSVGTGFSDRELDTLRARLDEARSEKRAFIGEPVPGKKHVWVEPRCVVEVGYHAITSDGMLRQPRFLRLRDDKSPKECASVSHTADVAPPAPKVAEPVERRVVVSNREKIFWPTDGYTKGDLVDYYQAIAPWLLPYLKDRPVVLTRYPDGIDGKNFFQKDAPPFVPEWLRTVRVWSEQSQRDIDYFVVDGVPALLYLANMASIPLHVWSSRVQTLPSPDWTIIDLDPKGAPFAHVVRVAKKVRAICDEIGLPTFVKTSGSTGLHVLMPLAASCTYEESRGLAELISRVVVAELPEICTIERVISARGGKVYLDYLQNGHGRLLVAPFSVRPLPGAPVSMPLRWSEVSEKVGPTAFTIKSAVARMKKLRADPFAGVLGAAPNLIDVLARLSERLAKTS